MEVRNSAALVLWLASAVLPGIDPVQTSREPAAGASERAIRADVDWALARALRKLEEASCRLIFTDFVDSEGRTLEQDLELRGETGPDLLRRLSFRDGTGIAPCGYEGVLAFTKLGGQVISICGPAFHRTLRDHPALAANILLHEALHRLGLEELPRFERASDDQPGKNRRMTSLEITDRIAARCGS